MKHLFVHHYWLYNGLTIGAIERKRLNTIRLDGVLPREFGAKYGDELQFELSHYHHYHLGSLWNFLLEFIYQKVTHAEGSYCLYASCISLNVTSFGCILICTLAQIELQLREFFMAMDMPQDIINIIVDYGADIALPYIEDLPVDSCVFNFLSNQFGLEGPEWPLTRTLVDMVNTMDDFKAYTDMWKMTQIENVLLAIKWPCIVTGGECRFQGRSHDQDSVTFINCTNSVEHILY